MRSIVRRHWESRAPRERLVIAIFAALLGIVLYVWLLHSTQHARLQLGASVADLRAQAIRLDRSANEIARLHATQATPLPPTDLHALVQAQVESTGLARSLVSIESVDATQVKLVFSAMPFADWLALVAKLQSLQVRLDATRIEALPASGLVNVTATFIRAGP